MTTNQIAYWNLTEAKRHNEAVEGETKRHNVVTETIQAAYNKGYLAELSRHNLAVETETTRSNFAREQETARHNQVVEIETHRANAANEELKRQANAIQEWYNHAIIGYNYSALAAQKAMHQSDLEFKYDQLALQKDQLAETKRANAANEALKARQIYNDYNVATINAITRKQELAETTEYHDAMDRHYERSDATADYNAATNRISALGRIATDVLDTFVDAKSRKYVADTNAESSKYSTDTDAKTKRDVAEINAAAKQSNSDGFDWMSILGPIYDYTFAP